MVSLQITNFSLKREICRAPIYSSHNTLSPGDIYLLGLNPGGKGYISIDKHLNDLLTKGTNSYLDEEWENGISKWSKGDAPLQKRVIYLIESLGYNVRDVCASNLIFVTSIKLSLL